MTTATITKSKFKAVRLYEDVFHGGGRVDAANGIIRGVKLVGFDSKNTGRTIGLDPREFGAAVDEPYSYGRQALIEAIPMYEGAPVRIDHPYSEIDGSGKRVIKQRSRSALSTSGEIRNVEMRDDGLYGDVHLILSHPHAGFLMEAAEKMPNKLAMSHNARGVPELIDGRVVINKILAVHSVDIVGDKPATTDGLFEDDSSQPPETEIPEMATSTTTETPMTLEDFQAAIAEILSDGSMTPESKLTAINDLCVSEPAADGAGSAAMESAMTLIESLGRDISAIRIKSVAALRSDASRKQLIESWPKKGEGRFRPARSAAALMESASDQAHDQKDFLRRLRGNGSPVSSADFVMGRR